MAEILGAAAAVAGLLDAAIRLIRQVQKAYERQQNLAEFLDKHALEIENINAIVRLVADENALQTAAVAVELTNLHIVGVKLLKCLKELDAGDKGKARQLAHQIMHGTKQEETLADVLTDLDRAKANLSLRVHLANVGLTRLVRDTVFANVEVVNRIDHLLTEVFGGGHGLKLADLLKGAAPQADDNLVPLSKAKIASLSLEAAQEPTLGVRALDDRTIDRIIYGNTARDSAIQLLGPVGKDLWEDIRVRIENNAASGHAVQFTYPTDFATFKYLLDHKERLAALETK